MFFFSANEKIRQAFKSNERCFVWLSSVYAFRRQQLTIMTEVEKPLKKISTFRTILPQILASTAKNLLLLDLGMAVAFPTIVIPALKGLKAHDNNDFLTLTDAQASWFGKKRLYSSSTSRFIFNSQRASHSFFSRLVASPVELCSSRWEERSRWY